MTNNRIVVVLCVAVVMLSMASAWAQNPVPQIVGYSVQPEEIEVGDSFTVTLTVKNAGGYSQDGGLTISFPDLQGSNDRNLVQDDYVPSGFTVYLRDVGDSIPHRYGGTVAVQYAVIEAAGEWAAGATKTLSVRVTPKNSGVFRIYLRSAMGNASWQYFNAPSSSSYTDQQGWPVYRYNGDVVEPTGDITVTVLNQSNGTPAGFNKIVVERWGGGLIDKRETNSSNQVTWADIDPGGYTFVAYVESTNPFDSYGEYWGSEFKTVSTGSNSLTISRKQPYTEDFRIVRVSDGQVLTSNTEIPTGTEVRIEATVRNKTSSSKNVRVRIAVDINRAPNFDIDWTSSYLSVSAGGTRTYSVNRTITQTGTYYKAVKTETSTDGKTDTWNWGGAFKAVEPTGDITVTVLNQNSGTPSVFNKIVVERWDGGLIDKRETTSSNQVTWNDIDPGGYTFVAYVESTNPFDSFGEYWGSEYKTVSTGVNSLTISRKQPFTEDFRVVRVSDDQVLTSSTEIPTGTEVRIEATVRNKTTSSKDVRVRIAVDINRALNFDIDWTSTYQSVPAGGTRTFSVTRTITQTGTYYKAVKTETSTDGKTDTWDWGGAFKAVEPEGDITVTVLNQNGDPPAVFNRIVVQRWDSELVDERATTSSNQVTWSDIEPGGYTFVAYVESTNPFDSFGEYWGSEYSNVDYGNNSLIIERVQPYTEVLRIVRVSDGVILDNTSEVPPGTEVRLEAIVRNNTTSAIPVRVRLVMDISRSEPFDVDWTSPFELVNAHSTGLFSTTRTMVESGTYFKAVKTETESDGKTDAWDWGQTIEVRPEDLILALFGESEGPPTAVSLFGNDYTVHEFSIPGADEPFYLPFSGWNAEPTAENLVSDVALAEAILRSRRFHQYFTNYERERENLIEVRNHYRLDSWWDTVVTHQLPMFSKRRAVRAQTGHLSLWAANEVLKLKWTGGSSLIPLLANGLVELPDLFSIENYPPEKLRQEIQSLVLAQSLYGGRLQNLNTLMTLTGLGEELQRLSKVGELGNRVREFTVAGSYLRGAETAASLGDLAAFNFHITHAYQELGKISAGLSYQIAENLVTGVLGWSNLDEEIRLSAWLMDSHSEAVAIVAKDMYDRLGRVEDFEDGIVVASPEELNHHYDFIMFSQGHLLWGLLTEHMSTQLLHLARVRAKTNTFTAAWLGASQSDVEDLSSTMNEARSAHIAYTGAYQHYLNGVQKDIAGFNGALLAVASQHSDNLLSVGRSDDSSVRLGSISTVDLSCFNGYAQPLQVVAVGSGSGPGGITFGSSSAPGISPLNTATIQLEVDVPVGYYTSVFGAVPISDLLASGHEIDKTVWVEVPIEWTVGGENFSRDFTVGITVRPDGEISSISPNKGLFRPGEVLHAEISHTVPGTVALWMMNPANGEKIHESFIGVSGGFAEFDYTIPLGPFGPYGFVGWIQDGVDMSTPPMYLNKVFIVVPSVVGDLTQFDFGNTRLIYPRADAGVANEIAGALGIPSESLVEVESNLGGLDSIAAGYYTILLGGGAANPLVNSISARIQGVLASDGDAIVEVISNSFGSQTSVVVAGYRASDTDIAAVGFIDAWAQLPSTKTLALTFAGMGSGSVSSVPSGLDCPDTCEAEFAFNQLVTLSAAPDGSSIFAGWSEESCGESFQCDVVMDRHRNVTALFAEDPEEFSLSVARTGTGSGRVTSNPLGIECGSDCTELYAEGTLVNLTATPDLGSTFAGWSGACSGTNDCSVTIESNLSVTALFTLSGVGDIHASADPMPVQTDLPSTITATVTDGAGAPVPAGTVVTFSTSYPGYFSGNNCSSVSSPSTTVTDGSGVTWIMFSSSVAGNANISISSPNVAGTVVPIEIFSPNADLDVSIAVGYVDGDASAATYKLEAFVTNTSTGAPVSGQRVDFTTSRGSLSPAYSVTDVTGAAEVILTITSSGDVTVTASVGWDSSATNFYAEVGGSVASQIYADGFESGDLSNWSAAVGEVQAAGIAGVSVSPTSLTVNPGASQTTNVTIARDSGFTGSVTLSIPDTLPSGVTASFSNPGVGNTGTVTITAGSSCALTTVSVRVRASATGVASRDANLSITTAQPAGIASVSLSPTSLTIAPGSSATTNVTIARESGFTGPVTLLIPDALPSGVTAGFNSPGTGNSGSVTITAGSSCQLTTASVRVRASSAGVASEDAQLSITTATSAENTGNGEIFLTGGSLAGQTLSSSQWEISVAPGDPITGNVIIQVENFMGASAVAPLGYTWTWGERSTAITSISGSISTGVTSWDVAIDLTAPSTPGTYYLLFGMNGEFNISQVLSCDNWSAGGSVVWNDGNDYHDMGESEIAFAHDSGFVESWQYRWATGYITSDVAMMPVRIVVSSSAGAGSYYPFDGTANDASGNDHHGTMSGAAWVAGHDGQALQFTNGTSSNVYVPREVYDGFGNTAYFEAWVYPTAVTTSNIFRKRGAYNDWSVNQNADGTISTTISGYVGTGGTNGWQAVGVVSPSPIPTNTWSKLVSWYDGETLTLSINDVPVASETKVLPLVWDVPTCPGDSYYADGCYYGTWIGSTSEYSRTVVHAPSTFSGIIDEVRILPSQPAGGTLLTDDFADGDSSGWQTFASGWSESDGVYHATNTAGNTPVSSVWADGYHWTDYSVEADVTPLSSYSPSAAGIVFRFQNPYPSSDFCSCSLNRGSTGEVLFLTCSGLAQSVPFDHNVGETYRLRATAVGSTVSCEVVGAPSSKMIASAPGASLSGTVGLRGTHIPADFDNVIVRGESPLDNGLAAYYPFSGNAEDGSGNDHHGTVNGAILSTGVTGTGDSAYAFDGADDYISSTPALPTENEPRTISVWFKTTSTSGSGGWENNTIFSYGTRQIGRLYSVSVYLGQLWFAAWGNDDGNLGFVADGNWHHLIAWFDGSNHQIWLDGAKILDRATTFNTAGSDFLIGRRVEESNQFMDGSIDEVRIYDRAVTEQEIQLLYNQFN